MDSGSPWGVRWEHLGVREPGGGGEGQPAGHGRRLEVQVGAAGGGCAEQGDPRVPGSSQGSSRASPHVRARPAQGLRGELRAWFKERG